MRYPICTSVLTPSATGNYLRKLLSSMTLVSTLVPILDATTSLEAMSISPRTYVLGEGLYEKFNKQ